MPKTILLMHGPNLNMLGRREKSHYGSFTLTDVETEMRKEAAARGYRLVAFQSNHEGALIDRIHQALATTTGMLLNAGAFTHYSYALLDALLLCDFPVVEVHISDIYKREPFRRLSVIRTACIDQVAGLGFDSYRLGLERLIDYLEAEADA